MAVDPNAMLPAPGQQPNALAQMGAQDYAGGPVIDQTPEPPPYEAPIPHETLVQWFEDSEEATLDSRTLSERDRDYVDNKQFTAAELKALEKRGQPAIIINRIKSKHQYLMGYEATQRTQPRGFPRTPNDEDAADACSDALRYVGDKADAAQRFSQVWDNMLVEGYGGVEVKVTPDGKGGGDIEILQAHWDRSFYDPHSREHDFEDARYKGLVVWLDEDEAVAMYPDAAEIITRTISEDAYRTYQDRPAWRQWAAGGKRKRVRIVQMYYRFGAQKDWHWSIFTKGGVIDEGQVPYRDEDGKSLCPMIFQSAFVDRENNRYGFVRQLIGPQDEINKRRSKALHLLMNRQTRSVKGAIDDIDQMKSELSKADGHVEINNLGNVPDAFGVIDTTAHFSGNVELANEAKAEIDLMGPNAALSGKQNQSASGRAVLASQQGGQIELTMLTDRQKHFKHRVYKLIWAMIRQYWTAETWIRVTDDENNLRFVGLNRTVTLAEELLNQTTAKGIDPEQAKQQIRVQAQNDPMFAQQLGQPIRTEHVPADMSMDIILDDVPDTANIQQEQFGMMVDLAKTGAVQFTPEQWIEMSGLHNKAGILKKIGDQQPDPAKQAATQAALEKALKELEKMNAEIDNLKSTAALNYAKADQTAASTVIQTPTLLPPQGSPQAPQQAQPVPQGGPQVAPQAQPQAPQQQPQIRQVYPPVRQVG